jgi:hypothetical protein
LTVNAEIVTRYYYQAQFKKQANILQSASFQQATVSSVLV